MVERMKVPTWIKPAVPYTAVLAAVLGGAWQAGRDYQSILSAVKANADTTIEVKKAVEGIAQDNKSLRSFGVYQSRRIDTLDANRGLINRTVQAPQIPMPLPDSVKQSPAINGQSLSEPLMLGRSDQQPQLSTKW